MKKAAGVSTPAYFKTNDNMNDTEYKDGGDRGAGTIRDTELI